MSEMISNAFHFIAVKSIESHGTKHRFLWIVCALLCCVVLCLRLEILILHNVTTGQNQINRNEISNTFVYVYNSNERIQHLFLPIKSIYFQPIGFFLSSISINVFSFFFVFAHARK